MLPQTHLDIHMFGTFEVFADKVPVLYLERRECKRLLAYLLLHSGQPVSCQIVANALWHTGSLDSLSQAKTALRQVLSSATERLQTHRGSLIFDSEGMTVDLLDFEKSARQEGRQSLEHALSLYRAPLLEGWTDGWATRARKQRHQQYLQVRKRLAQLLLDANDASGAISHLLALVSNHSHEEWGWRNLMQAYSLCEERIQAMSVYENYRTLLEGKGLAPPDEMKTLYSSLLQVPASSSGIKSEYPPDPPGGAMPLHAPAYLVRPTDEQFCDAVMRGDSIVLVKGPRQTGKSSLLARAVATARSRQTLVVRTSLQKLSGEHWASSDTFYRALARSLVEQLKLESDPDDFWNARRGSSENFERYLRQSVLTKVPGRLLWVQDEVDLIFPQPYSTEVFALFRSWHNERSFEPETPWKRMTLAMAYATEAHLYLTDLNQSPFNVGTRLYLEDFTPAQVKEINERYGKVLKTPLEQEQFFDLTGGIPYLVHRGIHEMKTRALLFPDWKAKTLQDGGCYEDHLQQMVRAVQQDIPLYTTLREFLTTHTCPERFAFYRLKSAGILAGAAPEDVHFRCTLYQRYLERNLI